MEKSVGPYQLGDSLGTLPFGELVTATHPARPEPLAVLFLDDRLAKDHRFRGLLRLEIARAGGVRHPAIARAVEVGEHAGAPYVVFERPAEAQPLARAFADGDPPSRDQAVALVRRLAEGLDTAHGRRLVHGALGPTSVLVGPSGSATLVGIGLIGAVDEAGLSAVIAERAETAFTAPEQHGRGRAVASWDGFALGALAAALLRVQPPPAGPADPVGNVLARQCSADPAARYPGCTAFARALADTIAPLTQAASDPAPVGTSAPTSPPAIAEPIRVPAAELLTAGTAPPPRMDPDAPTARPDAVAPHPSGPPPDSKHEQVTVATLDLTPAMAELLRLAPPRDLLGDVVRLAADRFPAVDEILDRYCPAGKVGPVPLGLAVSGALALLLILAGQAWPATVFGMVVVVLYAVPKLGAALTASERANPRAVRVTGGSTIKQTPDLISAARPLLVTGNSVTLSLRTPEYDILMPFGRPVTVERPAPGTIGVQEVVLWHDLPGATVTYITPNQILLDVRSQDGTVLYRRPPYPGEPGDRVWTPDDSRSSDLPTTATLSLEARGATAEAVSGPGSAPPPSPAPARSSGQRTMVPLPPAAQEALQRAARSAAWKAGAIVVGALVALIVFPQAVGNFGFFVFVAILGLAFRGSPAIVRGFNLWSARDQTTMARVVGPVVVTEHGSDKSRRYFAHLPDGTRIKIDGDSDRALAFAGEVRATQPSLVNFDEDRSTPEGLLQSQHEIPTATTMFVPGATLLLEIVNASGGTIYRDPALKEGDLGPPRVLV